MRTTTGYRPVMGTRMTLVIRPMPLTMTMTGFRVTRIVAMGILGGRPDWMIGSQDGIDQDCDGVDALAAISLGASGNQSNDYCVIRADGGRYCR